MKILIAGATGLVGGHLLEQSLDDERVEAVSILVRKNMERTHPKLTQIKTDFEHLSDVESAFRVDTVFCCLGTTIKKAGSKEAFHTVDFEYPLEMARLAKRQGAAVFSVITALGSDPNSAFFYSRVKGELEEALKDIPLAGIHIHRPAGILGNRNEDRPFEQFANKALNALAPLLIGPVKFMRPVQASRIAEVMLHEALSADSGFKIVESVNYQ